MDVEMKERIKRPATHAADDPCSSKTVKSRSNSLNTGVELLPPPNGAGLINAGETEPLSLEIEATTAIREPRTVESLSNQRKRSEMSLSARRNPVNQKFLALADSGT
ncbi:protein containing planctomycete cytochrome C domain protein [Anopheles sinensis]|uniref:Protein containing planctomycete cytochrome C domain protein n=1 Tax=Anopheles sinensis TaxID=74873 RepID=A0A084W9I5_ANOSI|nr:protein containing planctomycete cytochrome C domain protein [Anopheles sinensis]